MKYQAHFGELEKVSKLTTFYFLKIAKKSNGFILFGTANEGNAQLDACCCFSTPSIHNLSTF